MSRQARVDPVFAARDMNEKITGWLVIDETQPDNERVVSEHETQSEAIKAAETFEQSD